VYRALASNFNKIDVSKYEADGILVSLISSSFRVYRIDIWKELIVFDRENIVNISKFQIEDLKSDFFSFPVEAFK
jgi:hypothetical protein